MNVLLEFFHMHIDLNDLLDIIHRTCISVNVQLYRVY